MKLDKYSNTVSRAIAVAGITAAAMTGCRPAEREITQKDERTEMVKETRKSIGKEKYEFSSTGRLLKGRQGIALPRPLLEKAKAEKKLILPDEVDDIGSLSGVPIEEFEVEDSIYLSRLKDLSPLTGAPLKRININSSLVEDIEALRGMPLEEVDIGYTAVSDLTPLKDTKLKVLKLNCSPIESLDPIRGMPLEVFRTGSTNCHFSVKFSDFSPLEDCPLKEVALIQVQVSDISFLKGKSIEVLHLDKTKVKDLSVLKGMPLKELGLWGVTSVSDLSPLAGMPLQKLALNFTHVQNLEPLRGMPLKKLYLGGTPVTDLSPLAGMPLEYLELGKSVRDLRPIKDVVDRLRNKYFVDRSKNIERGLEVPFCSQINWDTYQLEPKKGENKPKHCN